MKHEFQAGRELDPSEIIFTVYPLALYGDAQICRNAKLLLPLHFNKKTPTARRDCGAKGSMGFALEGNNQELCSVVNVLLILSGMSTDK